MDFPRHYRMHHHGQELYPAQIPYWLENAKRRKGAETPIVILQYTRNGRIHLRWRGNDYPVPRGCMGLFYYGQDSGYGMRDSDLEDYEAEWIAITGPQLPEHLEAISELGGPVISAQHGPHVLAAFAAIRERFFGVNFDPLQGSADIYAFIMHCYRFAQSARADSVPPVEQAIQSILDNPFHSWSLKSLCARYECSREHFSRSFSQRVGQAPNQYLTTKRLEHACQLLRDTGLKIENIAGQSGFSSAHHLARCMRRHLKISPRDYRLHTRDMAPT